MPSRVAAHTIYKVSGSHIDSRPDLLAVEEPLEIRLGYGAMNDWQQHSLSVTMRTPGNDEELGLGFLWTEGIITDYEEVRSVQHCTDLGRDEQRGNVLRIELQPSVELDWSQLERHFYTTSSCGVCGKASIDAVRTTGCPVLPRGGMMVAPDVIHRLPDVLRDEQAIFEHTGGLHAAGLFDTEGNLLLMREDVGRHNAMDKLVGAALVRGWLPLHQHIVLLSGRSSFELVQKALMAGVPMLAAVGAPSSLAVELASEFGMTLLGFVRNGRFNVYGGVERVSEVPLPFTR